MSILSTKKLKFNQRELLLGAGFGLVDYDAISIEYLDFEMPQHIENAIFTSQHGVHAFFGHEEQRSNTTMQHCFCVGSKTKALLEKNGQKVIEMAQNSRELASFITKKYQNESFYYFCGSRRRDELPSLLTSGNVDLIEVKTYQTALKSRKFEQNWDGILFFSPSGVQSFLLENKIDNSNVFCIGGTTAAEAKKHANNVFIANDTSVESVIAKAITTLR